MMPAADEQRLTHAESRLAFLDDAVEKLSDVVARQDREIAELRLQVRALAGRLRELGEVAPGDAAGTGHEPTTHY